jgi:hypothetical protein
LAVRSNVPTAAGAVCHRNRSHCFHSHAMGLYGIDDTQRCLFGSIREEEGPPGGSAPTPTLSAGRSRVAVSSDGRQKHVMTQNCSSRGGSIRTATKAVQSEEAQMREIHPLRPVPRIAGENPGGHFHVRRLRSRQRSPVDRRQISCGRSINTLCRVGRNVMIVALCDSCP